MKNNLAIWSHWRELTIKFSALTFPVQSLSSFIVKIFSIAGQWLWLSWKCGQLQQKRCAIQIKTLEIFFYIELYLL